MVKNEFPPYAIKSYDDVGRINCEILRANGSSINSDEIFINKTGR